MEKHWHGSIEHIVYTALGVLIVFHVVRFTAARLVTVDNTTAQSIGKAAGALVSFPAS